MDVLHYVKQKDINMMLKICGKENKIMRNLSFYVICFPLSFRAVQFHVNQMCKLNKSLDKTYQRLMQTLQNHLITENFKKLHFCKAPSKQSKLLIKYDKSFQNRMINVFIRFVNERRKKKNFVDGNVEILCGNISICQY